VTSMLQLHTVPTANGFKASIMLEECELPYSTRVYDLRAGEHLSTEYLQLNPVGRLPTLVDPTGDEGRPLAVYGSAAILLYLAERAGRLLPSAAAARARVYHWLGIIASDLGPAYSGQFVFGTLAPEKLTWAIEFYDKLCLRLLAPLEQQLGRSRYLAGEEYSIADVIAYPVAAVSMQRFPGSFDGHPRIGSWAALVGARPAVQRGMRVGL